MFKEHGSSTQTVHPNAVEPSGLRPTAAARTDLQLAWTEELANLKGKSWLSVGLTEYRLQQIWWALKDADREAVKNGDKAERDENLTLRKFSETLEGQTGKSRATIYRDIQTVTALIELLGLAFVERLVATRAKITFASDLLDKLTEITEREMAIKIVKTHAAKGERRAWKAWDKAKATQERKSINERLANLTGNATEDDDQSGDTNPAEPWRNTVMYEDALTALRKLRAKSVQCFVTSPPFYRMRDYGTSVWFGGNPECDHDRKIEHAPFKKTARVTIKDNGENGNHRNRQASEAASKRTTYSCSKCGAWEGEFGQEPNPAAYIKHAVEHFREVRCVLRDDGLLWIEIGDSFDDSGNLLGIPWRLALALQADGWILRGDYIWDRAGSGMPETVRDRMARDHSYVFQFAKSPDYYYDATAIKEPAVGRTHTGRGGKVVRPGSGNRNNASFIGSIHKRSVSVRNARSVWRVAVGKNKLAHTSTFPPELVERCIIPSMSPYDEGGGACASCGAPWRATYLQPQTSPKASDPDRLPPPERLPYQPTCKCGCKERRPCVGGDMFAGTGTTLSVLKRLGHDYIGIELDAANADAIKVTVVEANACRKTTSRQTGGAS